MKALVAAVAFAATLAACGPAPASQAPSDVEAKEDAVFVGNVWSTSDAPWGYVIRSLQTYGCNGYTYKLVATYRQLYTYGPNYDWVDQIGDSSAAIDGPVDGGKDVYLSCNPGPGNPPTSYGFPMFWGNDYYHLNNQSLMACTLKTAAGLGTVTTTVYVDGVFYTAYPFSGAPRGELLIHFASGPANPWPGAGWCGPQYVLMQL